MSNTNREISNYDYRENGVSVVIPVFNGEKYIAECSNALINQTLKKMQFIFINDGSTDKSADLLNELRDKDPRIEVIHTENGGAGKARNNALNRIKYKYFGFVDIDDLPNLEMYEELYNYAEEQRLDCVCCSFNVISYSGEKTALKLPYSERVYEGREIIEDIIKPMLGFRKMNYDGMPSLCNKLFLTEIMVANKIIFVERTHGEDWQFCLEYFRHVKRFGFINKPLYSYIHQNEESYSQRLRDDFFISGINGWLLYEKLYPELDWQSKERELQRFPYETALYYRKFCNDKEKRKQKLEEMMIAISENSEIANRLDSRVVRISEKGNLLSLIRLLYRKTNLQFFAYQLKLMIKRMI